MNSISFVYTHSNTYMRFSQEGKKEKEKDALYVLYNTHNLKCIDVHIRYDYNNHNTHTLSYQRIKAKQSKAISAHI